MQKNPAMVAGCNYTWDIQNAVLLHICIFSNLHICFYLLRLLTVVVVRVCFLPRGPCTVVVLRVTR
jgi:hypothetical protein